MITAVNGTRVEDSNSLRNRIAAMSPGTDVALTILRDGHEEQLHAKLIELKDDNQAAASEGGGDKESGGGQLGISVEPVTSDIANRMKLKKTEGVVVTDVDPNSPAAEAGLQSGDVILEVNHQAVKSRRRYSRRREGCGLTSDSAADEPRWSEPLPRHSGEVVPPDDLARLVVALCDIRRGNGYPGEKRRGRSGR